MKPGRNGVWILTLLLVFLLAALGCQSKEERQLQTAPLKLTVAVYPTTYTRLIAVADAKGYFKKCGVEVAIQKHPSGTYALDAVCQGEAEIGTVVDFRFAWMMLLPIILGYTEMTLDKVNPSQSLHSDLIEIRNAASRSADLTRQLLTFARKQTICPEALDLNETMEGMLKMLRRLIGEYINLVWLPDKRLWQVMMDPFQIDQIMANLCVRSGIKA